MWTIKFPPGFFDIDPSLVTFLDKCPQVTTRQLSQGDFHITQVFHAQRLYDIIVAFVKVDERLFLLQCLLVGEEMKLVKHEVPPAVANNGEVGDITTVRFW